MGIVLNRKGREEELEVEKMFDKREEIENERRIDTTEKRKRNDKGRVKVRIIGSAISY